VIGAVAPILPSQRPARLCAAILDRRDTVPAPPFSTAVNKLGPDDIIVRYRGDEVIGLTILHASRRARVNGD